ncbi:MULTISPECIES: hypothetical protein [Glaesserella]|uniref:Alpha/beta hydrolase n=1 Tax=Glaesserella australis TaxID=2094024 RepID=A0A328C4B9_9PAST|nr:MULTISPECIES: hypothetical protein [Glaesserella]AUI66412.1 hypothetical protein CJD39_07365 [Glaesserella sp. 15-184]RAL19374.1 hypothetical protein C5N92_02700 [Glaesserella australis]
MEKVLFENENIRVIFSENDITDKDKLLIMFSPMNFSMKSIDDFYGKGIVKNNKINAISIMALKSHWYPENYMKDILGLINNISRSFQHIIIYGVSMGGYAAIKYSRRLGATHIIAMMPQWSININDIDDRRYYKEYSSLANELDNMAIKSEDISGDLYVFYDNYHKEDSLQVNKIIDIYHNVFVTHTPFVGHTLGHILIGSEFFLKLCHTVLKKDKNELIHLVRNKVRNHPMKYQGIMRNAFKRHISLLVGVIERLPNDHVIFNNALFVEEIKYLLSKIGDVNRLLRIITKFKQVSFENIYKFIMNRSLTYPVIYTAHENFLCFDLLNKKLVLCEDSEIKSNMFLIPLRFHYDAGILGVFEDNNTFIPLIDIGNKQFSLMSTMDFYSLGNYKMQPFLFYKKISNFFVISNGIFHATATPKKIIDFGKEHIKDWEKFQMKLLPNSGRDIL